jgi:peptidoglycan/LPS O-acetylase OafA/YrhL
MAQAANIEGRRWDSLDALRGIAAFLVVTFHCAQVSTGFAAARNPLSLSAWLDMWSWLKFTPLRLLVASGPPAVVLFFALSGFVLSLPFLRSSRQRGYGEFAIKRLCRIYPPFAFAVLVSAVLYALVAPSSIPELSPWFNTVLWDRPLSLDYIIRNLMMTGLPHDMTLDLVMWSLVHELRISLIFPLLFLATRRWPVASVVGSLGLGLACTAALAGNEATNLVTSLIDTARFVPLFVAGIVVAANVGAIRAGVARLPGRIVAFLWVASVVLLMAPGPSVSNYYDFIWGAGAVGLLVLTAGSLSADRLLSVPPLVWLGRVSYSLYLIHVPLLIAVVHLTYGMLPLWVTISGVVALSLVSAELMHRFVEKPSIWLGRRLTAPRPGMPALAAARRASR